MKLTYQFRIDKFVSEEQFNKIKNAMSATSNFYRYCINAFTFEDKAKKKHNVETIKELFLALKKKDFCTQYQINTQYANSISRDAKDKVELFNAQKESGLKRIEFSIYTLSKENDELDKQISLNQENLTYKDRKDLLRKIYFNNREIERLNKQHKKISKYTITCGEKKLQKTNIEQWKQLRKDGNFIVSLHDSFASYGNHHFKFQHIETNKFNLNLEVCNGEKININLQVKLDNKSRQNKICEILKNPIKHKVSYRLIKKKDKLFVQIGVIINNENNKLNENDNANVNIAGVDFNNGHLDFCIIKNNENLSFETIDFLYKNATSNQRKESLLLAIKQMFKQLKNNDVVVLKMENLDFSKLKLKHRKNSNNLKAMNRMIHSLPYSRYEKLMIIEAYKNNIKLILVNPAYTSRKAKDNLNPVYKQIDNLSIHQMAAYSIAIKN